MSIMRPRHQSCSVGYRPVVMSVDHVPFEAKARNRQAESKGAKLQTSYGHPNYADSISDTGRTKNYPIPSVDQPTNNYFGKTKK